MFLKGKLTYVSFMPSAVILLFSLICMLFNLDNKKKCLISLMHGVTMKMTGNMLNTKIYDFVHRRL
jgi:hypothetical protein